LFGKEFGAESGAGVRNFERGAIATLFAVMAKGNQAIALAWEATLAPDHSRTPEFSQLR
jgi:hypothetical protein